MKYLSYKEIEELAEAVTMDFFKSSELYLCPINTEVFATEYLKLNLGFRKLSDNAEVLGLTAYTDIYLDLLHDNISEKISVKAGTVLIDSSLKEQKKAGRRNFTIMHECAHQIFYRIDPESLFSSSMRSFKKDSTYSLRQLITRDDWSEWQANALASALLMPRQTVMLYMQYFVPQERLKSYGKNFFSESDSRHIEHMADFFGVSRSALIIRLHQLGYIEKHPFTELPSVIVYFEEEEAVVGQKG